MTFFPLWNWNKTALMSTDQVNVKYITLLKNFIKCPKIKGATFRAIKKIHHFLFGYLEWMTNSQIWTSFSNTQTKYSLAWLHQDHLPKPYWSYWSTTNQDPAHRSGAFKGNKHQNIPVMSFSKCWKWFLQSDVLDYRLALVTMVDKLFVGALKWINLEISQMRPKMVCFWCLMIAFKQSIALIHF